jgi:hypothetical protein
LVRVLDCLSLCLRFALCNTYAPHSAVVLLLLLLLQEDEDDACAPIACPHMFALCSLRDMYFFFSQDAFAAAAAGG